MTVWIAYASWFVGRSYVAYRDFILLVKSGCFSAFHLLVQASFWLFLPRCVVCTVRRKEDASENTFHSSHFASIWRTDFIWMAESHGILSTAEPFWAPEAVWVIHSWDSRAFESCLWGRATWSLTIPALSKETIKLHNARVWKTPSGLHSHTDKSYEWCKSSKSHPWIYFLHRWNHNNRLQISNFIPKPGCFNDSF